MKNLIFPPPLSLSLCPLIISYLTDILSDQCGISNAGSGSKGTMRSSWYVVRFPLAIHYTVFNSGFEMKGKFSGDVTLRPESRGWNEREKKKKIQLLNLFVFQPLQRLTTLLFAGSNASRWRYVVMGVSFVVFFSYGGISGCLDLAEFYLYRRFCTGKQQF